MRKVKKKRFNRKNSKHTDGEDDKDEGSDKNWKEMQIHYFSYL